MAFLQGFVAIINVIVGLPTVFYLSSTLWLWVVGSDNHPSDTGLFLSVLCAGVWGLWGGVQIWRNRAQWVNFLMMSGMMWLISSAATLGRNVPVELNLPFAIMANLNLIAAGLELRFRKE